jgi:hypothetical chaperone protein
MSARSAIGLDFGTTNSSIAWVSEGGEPVLASFDAGDGATETFRSVLYFDRGEDGEDPVSTHAGPFAIARYLAAEEKTGRLIQSLKSFLASRLFSATSIFGVSYRLESLIAIILRALREEAERTLEISIDRVVVGRPVHFVHADDESDAELALNRLAAGLRNAGFLEFSFEFEPVGAAYHYESDLQHDELILIADFGGGTSDFSLLRVGPSFRGGSRRRTILGNDGVPIAGDAFDGKLIRHLVTPLLGRGAEFRSQFGDTLPIPNWVFGRLERWHHLSFLKSPKVMGLLYDLRREAFEPEKLDALIHLIHRDLGFLLFRAVEATKRELSTGSSSRLQFEDDDLRIDVPVTRSQFESWIEEELAAISGCVDGLMARAEIECGDVDRVFLTGGSSFVPAVRRIFAERFGSERLRFGGELTSVANGLALRALE